MQQRPLQVNQKNISENGNTASASNKSQQENIDLFTNQLRRTNHANFVKLWRPAEGTIGQSDSAGYITNVTKPFRRMCISY